MRVLFPYAAAAEAGPLVADPRTLAMGVGKAAAAVALTRALSEEPADLVIAFGVAGAYSERGAPEIGGLCIVTHDGFADEGVATPEGFRSIGALGLGRDDPFAADGPLCERLAQALGGVPKVRGATVSTCSGTDARARELAERSGAAIETMEGAAIGLVCQRLGVRWAQVRCISNRTGDRDRGGWDLPLATRTLQRAVRRLLDARW